MKRVALLLLLLPLFNAVYAQGSDSLRILWIGNSYTYMNDLPGMVSKICAEQGLKLSATRFTRSGERLSGHYGNQRLLDTLAHGGWDYVVIQEYSSLPAQSTREVVDSTYHYAHLLDSLAHAGSPGVHVIYYMTWGHKKRNTHNKSMIDPDYPFDENYEDFQSRLRLSYLEMTYENRGWCSPVGMAWQTIRETHPEIELYVKDDYHPSFSGTYLAAHCFVTLLLQRTYTSSLRFNLPLLHATILQKTAQKTVLDNKRLLGLQRGHIFNYKYNAR